ncbi:MAG TPA: DNA topoisomerase IB [bacterium]|nr:DNA topoisomerase IB [bacterium]
MTKVRLHHTHDDVPGFTRKRVGERFVFFDLRDRVITNSRILKRCESIGIPPAYTAVWISADVLGHLQATAKDHRGRKQYFYHPAWNAHRDATKFEHLLPFALVIGKIRRHVARDLRLRGMPKEKVIAAVVRLLDTTYVRIGNEEYARENHSYGLTTLLHRHLRGKGVRMHLVFRGKSGVAHDVPLEDPRIRKIVAACQDLPGQELFAFEDDRGDIHQVRSEDVNTYLQTLTELEITAKDFRTWHGSVLAAHALAHTPLPDTLPARKREVNRAVKVAATALGNTAAVCRKCYIHPKLFELYVSGDLHFSHSLRQARRRYSGLHHDELEFVNLLEKW